MKRAYKSLAALCVVFAAAFPVRGAAASPLRSRQGRSIRIEWKKSIDLGGGGYARIHPLSDGRLMAAYAKGGSIIARFASPERLEKWSRPVVVADGFVTTNGSESVSVSLANAE